MNVFSNKMILLAVSAGAATTALGDVTVFVNDNPAFTSIRNGVWDEPTFYSRVSLLHDAHDQDPWTSGDHRPAIYLFSTETTGSSPQGVFFRGFNAEVAIGEYTEFSTQFFDSVMVPLPLELSAGDAVDSSVFDTTGDPSSPYEHPAVRYEFTATAPASNYIVAVSFTLEDGVHYGFIELNGNAANPRPVRWGYETEPNTPLVVPAAACGIADLNGDGELDFLDISAFLAAYSADEAAADLNNDGEYDFLDISAFLGAYGAGCP